MRSMQVIFVTILTSHSMCTADDRTKSKILETARRAITLAVSHKSAMATGPESVGLNPKP